MQSDPDRQSSFSSRAWLFSTAGFLGTAQFFSLARISSLGCSLLLLTALSAIAQAESCKTSSEMDAATKSAIVSAAQGYFAMAASSDVASLRKNSVSTAATDFADLEAAVKGKASGSPAARPPFLLEANGTAPIPHAEFLCGVFNRRGQTEGSADFKFDNLEPGKYAAVILDAPSANPPGAVAFVLQQQGNDWKIRSVYFAATEAAGHNADWYVNRARDYKRKQELHNAWLYYLEARILSSPLPFMSTAETDKLYDESQPLQPSDFPVGGEPAALASGDVTYKLTAVFPEAVGDDLDLIVKYQSSDVSDTAVAYQGNLAVMKALTTKFPELRDSFSAIVARAVEPTGRDYGTLMKMKEIR